MYWINLPKIKPFLLLIAIIALSVFKLNCQITSQGKDFWLAYLQNTTDREVTLHLMISSKEGASGNITIPGASWSSPFTVAPNSTVDIIIPKEYQLAGSNVVGAKGIHVVSDNNDINVFAMNYEYCTTDATLVLPNNALGSSYYAITYTPFYTAIIGIVAIENNTEIKISPPGETPFTVFLNQGETYQYKSSNDLTGTYISSQEFGNKKFALFTGNTCARVPTSKSYCDHLYEQMYPVNTWRRTYVTVPLKTRIGDTYRIVSSRNGTSIFINGNQVATLNAGEFYETILQEASKITSNHAIAVAQYSNGHEYDGALGDPFMILLSPIEQTRNNISFYVWTIPNIIGNYLNVVANTDCLSSIYLDGNPIQSLFVPVGADNSYSVAQIDIAQGTHSLVGSENCGFNAYVYGYGHDDSYGYAAGVSLDTLAIGLLVNTACAGFPSSFYVKSKPYEINTYYWDFGDANTSTDANPEHIYKQGGNYLVKLIVVYNDGDKDTVSQQFTIAEPKAKISYTGGGCGNKVVDFKDVSTITGDVISSRVWDFGDGYASQDINPEHTFINFGEYKVILKITSSFGCVSYDTVLINIYPMPIPNAGPDQEICLYDIITIGEVASGGTAPYQYKWTPTTDLSNPNIANPYAQPKTTTDYVVKVSDAHNCISYDTVRIIVNPLPLVEAGESREICWGDTTLIGSSSQSGTPPYKYYWYPNTNLNKNDELKVNAFPKTSTTYTVTITDSKGCSTKDTIEIKVNPLPEPVVTPLSPIVFCSCDSVILDGGNLGYVAYKWVTGETTQKITVRDPGIYYFDVIDTNGCKNRSDTILITVIYPNATIEIVPNSQNIMNSPTGTNIGMYLNIKESEHLDTCNVYNFITKLRLKKSILSPINTTPKGSLEGEDRIITLQGKRIKDNPKLIFLDFVSCLGNVEATEIAFDSFEWTDCPFEVATVNNMFTLTNVCKENKISRLIYAPQTTPNLIIKPNPVSYSAEMQIEMFEASWTRLSVNDILGRRIAVIHEGILNSGQWNMNFSTENITSGSYYVILETSNCVVTKMIEVKK